MLSGKSRPCCQRRPDHAVSGVLNSRRKKQSASGATVLLWCQTPVCESGATVLSVSDTSLRTAHPCCRCQTPRLRVAHPCCRRHLVCERRNRVVGVRHQFASGATVLSVSDTSLREWRNRVAMVSDIVCEGALALVENHLIIRYRTALPPSGRRRFMGRP
ncbi:MAG: hypothetical protein LBG05_10040 [Treponema sp.]|nr:hypothetical protein [Treponema sp.]